MKTSKQCYYITICRIQIGNSQEKSHNSFAHNNITRSVFCFVSNITKIEVHNRNDRNNTSLISIQRLIDTLIELN